MLTSLLLFLLALCCMTFGVSSAFRSLLIPRRFSAKILFEANIFHAIGTGRCKVTMADSESFGAGEEEFVGRNGVEKGEVLSATNQVGGESSSAAGKVHHMTVCLVPPPEAEHVWSIVHDGMRKQLKDPGFYRWPPHANLLYPFLDTCTEDDFLDEILDTIRNATSKIEPFSIRLNFLGTFGGKKRGVLWLAPDSSADIMNENLQIEDEIDNAPPPLMALHACLEEAFPMCKDQTKGGTFTPHMTLSHFKSLEDALQAQKLIEKEYVTELPKLEFCLDRIYLLRRQGDSGQFLRLADIGLGTAGRVEKWQSPVPFPGMSVKEEDWVHEERMKLKARRNGGRGKRSGSSKRARQSREPRIPDSAEVMAQKRADRKAKRERLEMEQQQMAALNEDADRETES